MLGAKALVYGAADRHRGRLLAAWSTCSRARRYIWDESGQPENFEVADVPADMKDIVEKYRAD